VPPGGGGEGQDWPRVGARRVGWESAGPTVAFLGALAEIFGLADLISGMATPGVLG